MYVCIELFVGFSFLDNNNISPLQNRIFCLNCNSNFFIFCSKQGIVQSKMKMLMSFLHSHVVSNLYMFLFYEKHKEKTGIQATLNHTEYHCTNKKNSHFSEYPRKKEGHTDLENQ